MKNGKRFFFHYIETFILTWDHFLLNENLLHSKSHHRSEFHELKSLWICLFSLHFIMFLYFFLFIFIVISSEMAIEKDFFLSLSIRSSLRSVFVQCIVVVRTRWTTFEVYVCYYSSCHYCSNYLFVYYRKTM